MKFFFSVILLSTVSLFFAQSQIGHTTITFNDPARTGGFGSGGGTGRQIQTEIYYPSTTAGDNVAVASGQFPVITFGHGFAMAWDAYTNIWQHYVNRGYILAFPRTEGGLIPGPSHGDFGTDLKQVSDKMLALNSNTSSIFNGKILQKAAIMGHSMGGGASFLAAANNANIETVIGLAPAETTPSAIAAAPNVTVPALVFSGSADGVTPPADHHIPIYQGLNSTCKSFVSITGGAHCYYANTNFNCDFGEGTSSPNISLTRAEQQATTFAILDPWLDFKLKGICDAYGAFLLAIESQPGTINETICPSLPSVTIINDPNQGSGVYCSSLQGNSYQWYMDNQPIVGETSQCYNIPVDLGATYQVEVFFENGCVYSTPITFESGVEEVNLKNVQVFPNPTSSELTFKSEELMMDLSIKDAMGKEVYFNKIYSDIFQLNLNVLPGIYLAEIKTTRGKVYVRFARN
ncbi:MAG: T9SS C-terminal target domain-containing protein [Flavobacteriales bacterium]|nr:T9SS C-terminal target domain-containing protein [Flavobacteriales bacterium]